MKVQGTKSEKNILTAFAGESQARNRYFFYSQKAYDEGHYNIAELFEKMEANEREHARIWYKLLQGELGDTRRNLLEAAESENQEWKHLYPTFAQEARREGLEELAIMFERIASIESDHERRFREAVLQLDQGKRSVPTPAQEAAYTCVFCGYSTVDSLPLCPVCGGRNSFSK